MYIAYPIPTKTILTNNKKSARLKQAVIAWAAYKQALQSCLGIWMRHTVIYIHSAQRFWWGKEKSASAPPIFASYCFVFHGYYGYIGAVLRLSNIASVTNLFLFVYEQVQDDIINDDRIEKWPIRWKVCKYLFRKKGKIAWFLFRTLSIMHAAEQ